MSDEITELYRAARARFDATIDTIQSNRERQADLRQSASDLDARARARRAELTAIVAAEEDADGKPLHTNEQKRTARLDELCADDERYQETSAQVLAERREIATLEHGIERLAAQQRLARLDMEYAIASINLESGRSA